jgi:hypothetical protein
MVQTSLWIRTMIFLSKFWEAPQPPPVRELEKMVSCVPGLTLRLFPANNATFLPQGPRNLWRAELIYSYTNSISLESTRPLSQSSLEFVGVLVTSI